jgi:hypothetical protein
MSKIHEVKVTGRDRGVEVIECIGYDRLRLPDL